MIMRIHNYIQRMERFTNLKVSKGNAESATETRSRALLVGISD